MTGPDREIVQLLSELASGAPDGAANDHRRARRDGRPAVGRIGGIRERTDDVLKAHAQPFPRHLGQDGLRPLPHFRRAHAYDHRGPAIGQEIEVERDLGANPCLAVAGESSPVREE